MGKRTRVFIKPISVNNCWQGRRFKTKEYKSFELEVLLKLKPMAIPTPPLELIIEFGLSNKLSDIDNGLKPLIDCLQKKYFFNDRDIYKIEVTKKIVKKGEEYFDFEIKTLPLL